MADTSVERARKIVEKNTDATIDRARPAFVTAVPRGEPRELLRNFHFNYPFMPVIPAPRLAQVIGTGVDTPHEFTLPDGTIWVMLSCYNPNGAGINALWSFDGIPPTFASLVAGIADKAVLNPPNNVAFLIYPSKQLQVRTNAAAIACVTPYIATDQAKIPAQQPNE